MLIRNAEIHFAALTDVQIDAGRVIAIGENLRPDADEIVIDANGHALIPGLHDHHIHFMSYAAALDSLVCGPPQMRDATQLQRALRQQAQRLREKNCSAWLRGIGYHDSIAGAVDRHWLDGVVADVPVRIQHRSGRLWILNSCALALLGDLSGAPLERIDGELSGRLYDADDWLRERIGKQLPDVRAASLQLAKYGFTGFTDTTLHNDAETFVQFAELQRRGDLLQNVVMMGDQSLSGLSGKKNIVVGATKIHLHDSELPDFEAMCNTIRMSHGAKRPVAIHCVTMAELVFSLAALESVGSMRGDRIEHAAIAPPDILQKIKQLQLIVVTQPNFIAERGDIYLREVDTVDRPWLYRLRGFIEAEIPLAAGTDASFGRANPWLAMQAAVTRRSGAGKIIGACEALNSEQALELFLGDPLMPGLAENQLQGRGKNRIEVGSRADLCVLDRAWRQARRNLAEVRVVTTIRDGEIIYAAS